MENKVICSSFLCCSFKERQLNPEITHTTAGQFHTTQLPHTNGALHCSGRDALVSCNGAEHACCLPHSSLEMMCTFFPPALGESISPHKLCHWGLFPKLIYKLFFTRPFPGSISSTTRGLTTTVSTHQSGIRSSHLSAPAQQLAAPALLVHHDAKQSKPASVPAVFICPAAGKGWTRGRLLRGSWGSSNSQQQDLLHQT